MAHWLAWRLPPSSSRDDGGGAPGTPQKVVQQASPKALQKSPAPHIDNAYVWWALQFTPHVAVLDAEAVLLEVSSTERLWGGREALRSLLVANAPRWEIAADDEDDVAGLWAEGPTALHALALLRANQRIKRTQRMPHAQLRRIPHDLPMDTLSALRPHLAALQNLGCKTLGDVRALPRAGVARRMGAACLLALDQLWGDCVHQFAWITLPERFDLEVELPWLAASTADLMHSAEHLLQTLQSWLRGRHQGILRLELRWRHDLRRLDGVELEPWGRMELRTSEPLQDMTHLRRLLSEQMAREQLAAPVNRIAMRSLEVASQQQSSESLLPSRAEDRSGEPWNQFVERVSARLGDAALQVPERLADHRPEHMQRWQAASSMLSKNRHIKPTAALDDPRAALWPAWLLKAPQLLPTRQHKPCLQGEPLSLKAGPERFESGWWQAESAPESATAHDEIRREYYVAHNARAGWVWVFKDLRTGDWFLHGVYA